MGRGTHRTILRGRLVLPTASAATAAIRASDHALIVVLLVDSRTAAAICSRRDAAAAATGACGASTRQRRKHANVQPLCADALRPDRDVLQMWEGLPRRVRQTQRAGRRKDLHMRRVHHHKDGRQAQRRSGGEQAVEGGQITRGLGAGAAEFAPVDRLSAAGEQRKDTELSGESSGESGGEDPGERRK